LSGPPILSTLQTCALLAVLLVLTGCISNDNEHEPRGVSLSQAMQTSANGGGQVPAHHESGGGQEYAGTGSNSETPLTGLGFLSLVSYDDRDYALQVPFDVSYAVPFGGNIQSLTRFTLTPISVEDEHIFFGLFLSGDTVKFRPGSLPDQALDDSWMFEGGIACRYYFTKAHTFLSPYVSASAAYQVLTWDYRNAIIVNGDTITSDSLNGAGGYVGLGVAINRESHLSFFGEAGVGGTVFVGDTYEGFHNDVFSDYGYFSLKLGLSLKF
jgi:hypothetical protein